MQNQPLRLKRGKLRNYSLKILVFVFCITALTLKGTKGFLFPHLESFAAKTIFIGQSSKMLLPSISGGVFSSVTPRAATKSTCLQNFSRVSKRARLRRPQMNDEGFDEKPRTKLLVVGLGNPGEEYTYTRHNAGFLAADELARRLGIDLTPKSFFLGSYGSGSFEGKSIGILKPKTYMNRSGESIRKVMDYFKITPADVLVLVDEVALDYGTLRLKAKGSAGGHNGLKSCQHHLKTQEYPRLRIGIGGPRVNLVKHVLGEFTKAERSDLDDFVSRAAEAAETWIKEDNIQLVMNTCNSVNKKQVQN